MVLIMAHRAMEDATTHRAMDLEPRPSLVSVGTSFYVVASSMARCAIMSTILEQRKKE